MRWAAFGRVPTTPRGGIRSSLSKSWNGKTRTPGKNSTSKDEIDLTTFDFQQNLPTPHLHHNDMFDLRQLWTFNSGIDDCIKEQGYMYLWSETTA